MEYVVVRAMEISRMGYEDTIKLQTKERNIKRCLLPSEIQESLSLPSLKETYQIPEVETAQGQYYQVVMGMLRSNKALPRYSDYSITDVEEIHKFDSKIRQLSDDMKIDFMFRTGKPKKRNLAEELE